MRRLLPGDLLIPTTAGAYDRSETHTRLMGAGALLRIAIPGLFAMEHGAFALGQIVLGVEGVAALN